VFVCKVLLITFKWCLVFIKGNNFGNKKRPKPLDVIRGLIENGAKVMKTKLTHSLTHSWVLLRRRLYVCFPAAEEFDDRVQHFR